MNIIFFTAAFPRFGESNIYSDLLNEFYKNGHSVYVVTQKERRYGGITSFVCESGLNTLRIKTGNLTGRVNLIEKGLSTITLSLLMKYNIRKYMRDIQFDMVIFSTPPVTLYNIVSYIKRRDNAFVYLLLKDIFPQNAVDLGMIRNGSLIHNYFRRIEIKMYKISDKIGCMSNANSEYLLYHNYNVQPYKVEVCYNSINPTDIIIDDEARVCIRNRYNIPLGKVVFVFGGNLGKPQNIDYIIDCIRSSEGCIQAHFVIVGAGQEYSKLEKIVANGQRNITLISSIPYTEYNMLVASCDIGLIFLSYKFTIPNFPSRVLSYLNASLPILASTDCSTDLKWHIEEGKFGWWCKSNDAGIYSLLVKEVCNTSLESYRKNAVEYLHSKFTVHLAYKTIIDSFDHYIKSQISIT